VTSTSLHVLHDLAGQLPARPGQNAAPFAGDPHRYVDSQPVFRQFFCPDGRRRQG